MIALKNLTFFSIFFLLSFKPVISQNLDIENNKEKLRQVLRFHLSIHVLEFL